MLVKGAPGLNSVMVNSTMIIGHAYNYNVTTRLGWGITVASYLARWRLKSPALRVFTQPFIQVQIKENIKAPRHWPLCGEFTGDRWNPLTKGQLSGKCFHLMTSSWGIQLILPRPSVISDAHWLGSTHFGREKWPSCCRRHFFISIRMSLKLVRKIPIDNEPALVQIMAWRRTGDKPLSKPMMD